MITKADELMDVYSGLTKAEQRKFDKRYRAHKRYCSTLEGLATGKIAMVNRRKNGTFEFGEKTYANTQAGKDLLTSAVVKSGAKKIIVHEEE